MAATGRVGGARLGMEPRRRRTIGGAAGSGRGAPRLRTPPEAAAPYRRAPSVARPATPICAARRTFFERQHRLPLAAAVRFTPSSPTTSRRAASSSRARLPRWRAAAAQLVWHADRRGGGQSAHRVRLDGRFEVRSARPTPLRPATVHCSGATVGRNAWQPIDHGTRAHFFADVGGLYDGFDALVCSRLRLPQLVQQGAISRWRGCARRRTRYAQAPGSTSTTRCARVVRWRRAARKARRACRLQGRCSATRRSGRAMGGNAHGTASSTIPRLSLAC